MTDHFPDTDTKAASVVGGASHGGSASYFSSAMSSVSSHIGQTHVALNAPSSLAVWWQRTRSDSEVRLSEFQALPAGSDGRPLSVGSLGHLLAHEMCRICHFNSRSPGSCWKGRLCDFCHVPHTLNASTSCILCWADEALIQAPLMASGSL